MSFTDISVTVNAAEVFSRMQTSLGRRKNQGGGGSSPQAISVRLDIPGLYLKPVMSTQVRLKVSIQGLNYARAQRGSVDDWKPGHNHHAAEDCMLQNSRVLILTFSEGCSWVD